MGEKLPAVSGRDAIRAFGRLGGVRVRQRGGHVVLSEDGHSATQSVRVHRELAKGTLRGLIGAAGLAVDDFIPANDVWRTVI